MISYEFDFRGTVYGYGIVTANNEEEAKEKVLAGDYDDIIETYDMQITEVSEVKENN